MRGWVKAVVWVLILLACAGVGAFIASRSDLFPPEVRHGDPTSTPSPPGEEPARWRLTMTSRTRHVYRVGGSCASDWRMRTRIRVSPGGRVRGIGTVRLLAGAACDFETAQVQAEAVRIRIVGRRVGDVLRLRLGVLEVRPRGAQDLGGFVGTVPVMRFSLEEQDGATVREQTQVREGDGEGLLARSGLRLAA